MRIVVKVGTSTLAHPTGRLNIQRMERLCKVLSDLKNMGHEIILVSSGAIAMGFGKLNLRERPKDVPTKQASAAVGQCELMYTYDKLFTEYNHTVAQLLITAPDIEEGGSRRENFHKTPPPSEMICSSMTSTVSMSFASGFLRGSPSKSPSMSESRIKRSALTVT